MAQHRTQVLSRGPMNHTPVCSCDWVGNDHTTRDAATAEANDHRISETRAKRNNVTAPPAKAR